MNPVSEWDMRFKKGGYIWGKEPSQTALESVKYLKPDFKVLDIGCAYGRDCKFLNERGIKTTGIDLCKEAIRLGREFIPPSDLLVADAMQMPFEDSQFDALFSHLFLHLLYKQEDRRRFLKECTRVLKTNGLMLHSFFSTKDPTFGEGEEISKNTFYVKEKARTAHYFDECEVRSDFSGSDILELRKLTEDHTHGSPHTHVYWFIVARKPA